MKKTAGAAKKAQQVREKRAAYVRTPTVKAMAASSRLQLLGAEVPKEVVDFCNRDHVLEHLILAGELISQCFADVRGLDPRVEVDPETGEEAVVINLTIAGEIDDLVKRSQQFSSAFVAKVPWPGRDKIHLCYNVV